MGMQGDSPFELPPSDGEEDLDQAQGGNRQ